MFEYLTTLQHEMIRISRKLLLTITSVISTKVLYNLIIILKLSVKKIHWNWLEAVFRWRFIFVVYCVPPKKERSWVPIEMKGLFEDELLSHKLEHDSSEVYDFNLKKTLTILQKYKIININNKKLRIQDYHRSVYLFFFFINDCYIKETTYI